MAMYFPNHLQNQVCFSRGGRNGGAIGDNIVRDLEFSPSMDQLRKKFHRSLDLNRQMFTPFPIELIGPHFPLEWQNCCKNKVKMGCPIRDANKRCLMETEMNRNVKRSYVDLTLRLSPPGMYAKVELPDQSVISSPLPQRSCMSLDLNPNEDRNGTGTLIVMNPNEDHNGTGTLIVMGCTRCLIYVMVSEVDPQCPKCKSSVLLDMFRESPAKKMRKC